MTDSDPPPPARVCVLGDHMLLDRRHIDLMHDPPKLFDMQRRVISLREQVWAAPDMELVWHPVTLGRDGEEHAELIIVCTTFGDSYRAAQHLLEHLLVHNCTASAILLVGTEATSARKPKIMTSSHYVGTSVSSNWQTIFAEARRLIEDYRRPDDLDSD